MSSASEKIPWSVPLADSSLSIVLIRMAKFSPWLTSRGTPEIEMSKEKEGEGERERERERDGSGEILCLTMHAN